MHLRAQSGFPCMFMEQRKAWMGEQKVTVTTYESCGSLCPIWWSWSESVWLFAIPGTISPWNSPSQNTGLVSFTFPRGLSQFRDWTQVSHIAGGFFTSWSMKEALCPTCYHLFLLLQYTHAIKWWHLFLHPFDLAWYVIACSEKSYMVEMTLIISRIHQCEYWYFPPSCLFSSFLCFFLIFSSTFIEIQNWHSEVYKFKVYSIMIWLLYIMKWLPQVKFSEYSSYCIDT